ncbi:hypothetical protein HYY72_05485 [Candidatus Woesearchaeota archaeon]|nr:hypothetical protein [Candidatus Woesearchaeota archaeon]
MKRVILDSNIYGRILLLIEKLAVQYYLAYKKLGGKADYRQMGEDLTIVATATLNNLEVIYSDDKKTMLSKEAIDSYKLVNDLHDIPLPMLKSYKEFKQELERGDKGWN